MLNPLQLHEIVSRPPVTALPSCVARADLAVYAVRAQEGNSYRFYREPAQIPA